MGKVLVQPGFGAVVEVDGVVTSVLGPGRHPLPGRSRRRQVTLVDQREKLLVVSGQEVSSSDVPGVKVTAVARWRVSDPAAWCHVSTAPDDEVRLAVQLAVRDWAAEGTVEELVVRRGAATESLTASVAAAVERLGAAVSHVAIRDLVVPHEVRRAVMAVQSARQEGLVALERARGETAALRALANGAKILADHPALLQLWTVQAAGAARGTVVVEIPRHG